MWLSFLALLGLYTFLSFLYDTLKSPLQLLHHKWLERNNQAKTLTEKYGKWAAITGSSDGIGKAYAKELARRGLNVVLIARNLTKLQQVAQEIETECGVETFIIQTDFAKGAEVYEHLYKELAKKPIGILVNNVGIGHNPPGTVSTFTPNHIWDMINVNVAAATLLSRHFVDKWYQSGGKGCIVNLSSFLGLQPTPYGSVYGASKAYIRSFTLALQHEVEPLGITVQLVSPTIVVTKIHNYSKLVMNSSNIMTNPVEDYGKWAVETIGKVSETTGYFWQGIVITIWNSIHIRLRPKLLMSLCRFLADDLSNLKKKK